jgi:NAD(P)-dependent dehydrogenase (short-subunit alcohol dehydrogenase family)
MQRKLEGKIALITGGSHGIGAAIAKRPAADGANVAITYTKGADAASPRFEPNSFGSDRSNNRPSTKSTFYDET